MLTTPNRFGLGRRLVEQGRDLGEAPRGLRRRQPSRVWWGSRRLHRSGTAGVGDHEERATGGGESKRESQTLFRACCAPAAAGCPDPDGSPGLVPDLFRAVPRNRLEDRSRPVPCSSSLGRTDREPIWGLWVVLGVADLVLKIGQRCRVTGVTGPASGGSSPRNRSRITPQGSSGCGARRWSARGVLQDGERRPPGVLDDGESPVGRVLGGHRDLAAALLHRRHRVIGRDHREAGRPTLR